MIYNDNNNDNDILKITKSKISKINLDTLIIKLQTES